MSAINVMFTRTFDGDYFADFDCNDSELPHDTDVFFFDAIPSVELTLLQAERTILEADRVELLRDVARLQRDLDNETLRRKSVESGLALVIEQYTKVMEHLNKYERTVA